MVFEEENNEVTVEVDGVEKEFPLPSDYERGGTNNNATLITQGEAVSPRVAKFRKSVALATARYGESSQSEDNNRGLGNDEDSSVEEDETHSSSDDEGSNSSSVKILPRSKEAIEQEELEYQKAKNQIINQAVDKSFEKLAQLLRDSGLVMPEHKETQKGREKHTNEGQKGKQVKKFKEGEINSVIMGSNSETTIYNNAVGKEKSNSSKQGSTSSEEINTSDELIEAVGDNFNDLNLFTGRHVNMKGHGRDPFYDEPPRAGGSRATENDRGDRNREKERQYEKDARAKADQQIRDVEASKPRILEPKGNFNDHLPHFDNPDNRRHVSVTQDDGYESEDNEHEDH